MELLDINARGFFRAAAGSVLQHAPSVSDGISVTLNPLQAATKTLVFSAPHFGRRGLGALGLLTADGRLIDGVPLHRATDVNLEKLVLQFAAISGYPIVGALYSRLFVNGAVPDSLAVSPTTPDGVPIPGYQNGLFDQRRAAALQLHRAYNLTLARQIRLGGTFVGSLDTFTPKSLAGDFGERRDMAISIIAANSHLQRAEELRRHLTSGLTPYLTAVRNATAHAVNSIEPVAINKPYGEQMHHRLADLQRGGITIEVRSDILDDASIAAALARTLHDAIGKVYGCMAAPEADGLPAGDARTGHITAYWPGSLRAPSYQVPARVATVPRALG